MFTFYKFVVCLCVAPEIAPSDLTVVDVTGTSITLRWNPLTTGLNGMVRGYNIICRYGNGQMFTVSQHQALLTYLILYLEKFLRFKVLKVTT